MHELDSSSDGHDFQTNPQVPPVIRSEGADSNGSLEFPPSDITAPEVPKNAAGQPPDLPPPPGASPETGPEPDPEAFELGRIFEAIGDFNEGHAPERYGGRLDPVPADLRSGSDEETEEGPHAMDNALFRETNRTALAAFGLDIDVEIPANYVDFRIKDGGLLVSRLRELHEDAVTASFAGGFLALVDNFSVIVPREVIRMHFDEARQTGGLDVDGVLMARTPEDLDRFAQTMTDVPEGERRSIAETLDCADDLSTELARFGVPEDSLQALKDVRVYANEGHFVDWAVASEIGLNVNLDKVEPGAAHWPIWNTTGPWEQTFAFLDNVQGRSLPGEKFFPNLVNRMDENLTRVIALEDQREVGAEEILEQQAHVVLLRYAQERLRAYK